MAVRGAPAIAISAALSLAVELVRGGAGKQFATADSASEAVCDKMDYLVTRFAQQWRHNQRKEGRTCGRET